MGASKEIVRFNPPAAHAVADAMMAAQHHFMREFVYRPPSLALPQLDQELARRSQFQCQNGSANALYHLLTNSPTLFDHMLMFVGTRTDDKKFNRNPNWPNHVYFLAHSTEGTWYGGSPANYRVGSLLPDALTHIVSSKNLEDVVTDIQDIEGGLWPDAEFVQAAIAENKMPPSYRGQNVQEEMPYIFVLTVTSNKEQNYTSHKRYDLFDDYL